MEQIRCNLFVVFLVFRCGPPSFQALNIDFQSVFSVDPKPTAHRFVVAQKLATNHWFEKNANILKGSGFCMNCNKLCNVPETELDILAIGFPCAPFSRMRSKKVVRSHLGNSGIAMGHRRESCGARALRTLPPGGPQQLHSES